MFTAQELDRINVAAIAKNMTFDEVIKVINLSKVNDSPVLKKEDIVRLLDQRIVLQPCDIHAIDLDVERVFINSGYLEFLCSDPSVVNVETAVEVYEIVKDSTLAQIFSSFDVELGSLCLTHHQIKQFIAHNVNYLSTMPNSTFFLFKIAEHEPASIDNLCVVNIRMSPWESSHLASYHCTLFDSERIFESHGYRMVLPKNK